MSISPFTIRGIVEGFYGPFYTAPEREDLIRFMARHGYNVYIYAPKNDRQHRMRWREAYPAKIMEQFRQAVALSVELGVTFCYAISPGVNMCYSCEDEFVSLTQKLKSFYEIGVRAFSIALDDIEAEFQHEADRQRYSTYAEAHADVCNRLYNWLQSLDSASTLSMCPVDYHGAPPFSDYLHELGAKLHPDIDIFYTGTQICAETVTVNEVQAFAEAVRRQPILWDNYPVNDLAMTGELHLGPICGRDHCLHTVVKGVMVNPMIQLEASKIPLLTYADYLHHPVHYSPHLTWQWALWVVGGDESVDELRIFAENALSSCLGTQESELQKRVNAVMVSLHAGNLVHNNWAVEALDAYFTEVDEACYHLKFRMDNLALRNNLLPWIEALEVWMWVGRRALTVLRGLEHGCDVTAPMSAMLDSFEMAQKQPKRIGGEVLLPLIDYAHSHVPSLRHIS